MRFSIPKTVEEMENVVYNELGDTWTVEQNGELGLRKHGIHYNYGKDGDYRTVTISFKLETGMDICLNDLHNALVRTMFYMHWEFSYSSIKLFENASWINFRFVEWPIEQHIDCREIK